MKFAFRMLPEAIRDLLPFISPLAFETIAWRDLLRDIRSVVANASRDPDPMQAAMQPHLPDGVELQFGERPDIPNLKSAPEQDRQALGDLVLATYFRQFLCTEGLFLDLRPSRFYATDANAMVWQPSRLQMTLAPAFRRGVINLYCGFYYNDEERFDQSLSELGLAAADDGDEAKLAQRSRLKTILRQHFGTADEAPMRFTMDEFKHSFQRLFKHFVDERIKLQSDFIFLGACLTGLYMTLDELGCAHDVGRIFREQIQQTDESL